LGGGVKLKKSWLSIFLPSDEYKEKNILYFLAESSIILVVLCMSFLVINRFSSLNELSGNLLIGVLLGVMVIYTFLRYIFSGVEYTNIFSGKEYKKEIKNIFLQSFKFVFIFLILYLIFFGVPGEQEDWIDIIGLSILIIFFMSLINYISLKRSYKKNKELEEDDILNNKIDK
jgi:amino acid transporter